MNAYVLVGHVAVPVSIKDWFLQPVEERRVAEDERDGVRVSTVFVGLDLGFGGEVQLFETMVLGGEHHEYERRTATWAEAVQAHAEVVAMVRVSQEGG